MGEAAIAAFDRCASLLRRGLVSGGDIGELLSLLEATTNGVGMSMSQGYGVGPEELLRNIDPAWPAAYLPHLGEDPAPRYLATNGPLPIYCVSRQADASMWDAPLGQTFAKGGHGDAAITKVGGTELVPEIVFASYRPHKAKPYTTAALTRLRALLPLLELALSCQSARAAFEVPRDETEARALRRLKAYARLGHVDGDITLSPAAERLFHRLFDGFGPRGKRRIELALRAAAKDFLAGRGPRVIPLRADLDAELALLPMTNSDATLLAVFRTPRPEMGRSLPFEELLTPSQRRVARSLAEGATIPAIASGLQLSTESVRTHVKEIYRRLGASSRAELARLYK